MMEQDQKNNKEGKAMFSNELSLEATVSMYREDSISVNKAYHDLITLQESQIKAINNALQLYNLAQDKAE